MKPTTFEQEDETHDGSDSFLCDENGRSTQDWSLVPQPRASSPKHWKGVVISKITSACYFQILLLYALCSHLGKGSTWGFTLGVDHGEVWLELNWSSTTSNIDGLSLLYGLQTKNIKMKQVLCSYILWVGLKNFKTWLTLEDVNKFQESQE